MAGASVRQCLVCLVSGTFVVGWQRGCRKAGCLGVATVYLHLRALVFCGAGADTIGVEAHAG